MATESATLERLRSEIAALKTERDALEAALPPHGLKPGHLLRLEELEDRLEEKRRELSSLTGE